jgi:hypothetical protein
MRARYDLSSADDRDRGGTLLPLLISAAVEFDGTINDVLSAVRSVEATAEKAPAGSASRFSESARGACDSARRLPAMHSRSRIDMIAIERAEPFRESLEGRIRCRCGGAS